MCCMAVHGGHSGDKPVLCTTFFLSSPSQLGAVGVLMLWSGVTLVGGISPS